jgi:hypothetical protein
VDTAVVDTRDVVRPRTSMAAPVVEDPTVAAAVASTAEVVEDSMAEAAVAPTVGAALTVAADAGKRIHQEFNNGWQR